MVGHLNMMILLFSLWVTACVTDSTIISLVGKWLHSGSLNSRYDLECPDLLQLQGNGKYSIFNDCYALSARTAIVETGSWKFDGESKKLFLSDRQFDTNYYFISKDGLLSIQVKHVSKNELHFVSDGALVEVYKRVGEY